MPPAVVTSASTAGTEVTVVIDYDSPVRLPIVGLVARSFHLHGQATMVVET